MDRNGQVWIKGNDSEFESFQDGESFPKEQYLWCNKFWIEFHKNTKNIKIYKSSTMQLCQILPFHYFNVSGIKWNQEQSSFIAFDDSKNQYCVIERI